MEVQVLKRKFTFNGLSLEDPGSGMAPEAVRDAYSAAYPELTTADVAFIGVENDYQVYEFKKKVGDKG